MTRQKGMMVPNIVVIVLNWNNTHETGLCLQSVLASDRADFQVLVIDNNSSDDSIAQITAGIPRVHLLQNDENLGYAGGNNVGIRHALGMGAEWVLVLNNDTTIARDCLAELIQATRDFPDGGAFGPLVLQADSPAEIQAAGGFFSDGLRYSWHAANEALATQLDRVFATDLLPGCALLLSRKALDQVGLFDDRLFAYREDIDLCLRLSAADFKLYVVPAARIWHHRQVVGKQIPPHIVYYMARNSLLLARKHRPAETWRFLWQDLTAWILWNTSPRWRGMKLQAAARADGVIDFFLGRFGRSQKWSPEKS